MENIDYMLGLQRNVNHNNRLDAKYLEDPIIESLITRRKLLASTEGVGARFTDPHAGNARLADQCGTPSLGAWRLWTDCAVGFLALFLQFHNFASLVGSIILAGCGGGGELWRGNPTADPDDFFGQRDLRSVQYPDRKDKPMLCLCFWDGKL